MKRRWPARQRRYGVDTRSRPITEAALELRERTARIRAAARKGKTSKEIADVFDFPLKMVDQILAPIEGARLSDPVQLLKDRAAAAGLAAADIQLYWVGFLTAAGRISGQGASSVLIVTLGDRAQKHMDALMEDLATPQVRHEFCESNLLGWQLYLRNADLCSALLRWGIPSDRLGDDPTVLNDLPGEWVAAFLRGYLDGSWMAGTIGTRPKGLVFYGTEAVLTAINAMIHRNWRIGPGMVTSRPPRAELRFTRKDEQAILERTLTYATRSRRPTKQRPA